jgi:1-acyl-sn-glycerol-3-phosphate acyltransferase
MPPDYPPLPWKIVLEVARAALVGQRRSIHEDALSCTRSLDITVAGREYVPPFGPALVVMNHYQRPGFQAWWFALAISAALPVDAHWMMTSAWTDDGTPGAWWRSRLSTLILPRLAQVYGFTSMPPMPPRAHEVRARAAAVRHLLAVARRQPAPLVALSPEGQDSPDGRLMHPHPGVGRLLMLLAGHGYPVFPVGVFEDGCALVLNFGPPFSLVLPPDGNPGQRDRQAAQQVMAAIAALLPVTLRGVYDGT